MQGNLSSWPTPEDRDPGRHPGLRYQSTYSAARSARPRAGKLATVNPVSRDSSTSLWADS